MMVATAVFAAAVASMALNIGPPGTGSLRPGDAALLLGLIAAGFNLGTMAAICGKD